MTNYLNVTCCKGRHQNSWEIPYLYIVKIDVLTPSPRLTLQPNFPFSMGKGKFACKDRHFYPRPRLSLQCKDMEFPRNFDVVPKFVPHYLTHDCALLIILPINILIDNCHFE